MNCDYYEGFRLTDSWQATRTLWVACVEPIEKDGEVVAAAKLKVYAGDPEYLAFIYAEAYRKLRQYMQLRESKGGA